MSELKPCPFCGGEAELWHNAHWDYVVRCTKCGAKTRQHHENGAGATMDWNKRHDERGECRNVAEPPRNTMFWPVPHFQCSECKALHISMDYVDYCPICGRKVVDE